MGHGGKRKGAGRKSNAEIARARQVFRSVIPEARWRRIIENLAKLAEKEQSRSALEAFRLLAPYSFGVPTENNAGDESVDAARRGRVPRTGAGQCRSLPVAVRCSQARSDA